MGTTLENGVYLPSEGERNCYAGLKTNWEILDQKVADVTALQQAVAGALHREIVESLPTTDIDPNTIYMVLSGTSATENVYNEFMYVNNAWELIGTSATDLTNYYTKSEVDGKLLLKASASDLTSHTGDTTIHVTASDKNKWNNNTYVFRYSSTALVASSTNSNTLLDNTDNLKVGDKVIDSSGVLFSITAIDTANSTFTVGSALIDLALDANVVHTSGNENITGKKTFLGVSVNFKSSVGVYGSAGGNASINMYDKNSMLVSYLRQGLYNNGLPYIKIALQGIDENNQTFEKSLAYSWLGNVNQAYFRPETDNFVYLGAENNKWKSVYATEYYYGSNNVEFSTKFVTTDTAQTISGVKNFAVDVGILNTDTTANTPNLNLRNYRVNRATTDTGVQAIQFLDKNAKALTLIESRRISNGNTGTNILTYNTDDSNNTVSGGVSIIKSKTDTSFSPNADNAVTCGRALAKWSDVQTYKVNGVEPSSLSLPDLNNGIDISSYIDVSQVSTNYYTPPANGWISISVISSIRDSIQIESSSGFSSGAYACTNPNNTSEYIASIIVPCVKNDTVTIYFRSFANTSTIKYAKFFPCQGNV